MLQLDPLKRPSINQIVRKILTRSSNNIRSNKIVTYSFSKRILVFSYYIA